MSEVRRQVIRATLDISSAILELEEALKDAKEPVADAIDRVLVELGAQRTNLAEMERQGLVA